MDTAVRNNRSTRTTHTRVWMTRCLVNPLPVHYDALNNGSSKGLPFTCWVRDLILITICPCESILNGIVERKIIMHLQRTN